VLNLQDRHHPGGMRENNRAENSHLVIRRRERKQQKFKSQGSAQRFLSSHGPIYNAFNLQPHLIYQAGLRSLRGHAEAALAAATQAVWLGRRGGAFAGWAGLTCQHPKKRVDAIFGAGPATDAPANAVGSAMQRIQKLDADRKRERHMQQFKSKPWSQHFLTVHAAVYNPFNVQRHLASWATIKVLHNQAHQD